MSPAPRIFVVFEESYARGALATLSSLARHATQPLRVDVMLRASALPAAERLMARLRGLYADRLDLRPLVVPPAILAACDAFSFKAHFVAEILFRLYYFDLAEPCEAPVLYLDIDLVWRRNVADLFRLPTGDALLYAAEAGIHAVSHRVLPPHVTRYLNSGLLLFPAGRWSEIAARMRDARDIVRQIAPDAHYLDQDALAIAFDGRIGYLPRIWNFTLADHAGHPPPGDVAVLHATGSRKPWFFRGGHPFTFAYREEMDAINAGLFERHDFFWAPRRALRRAQETIGRRA